MINKRVSRCGVLLFDVFVDRLREIAIFLAHHLRRQTNTGQRRAQVVADARHQQHCGHRPIVSRRLPYGYLSLEAHLGRHAYSRSGGEGVIPFYLQQGMFRSLTVDSVYRNKQPRAACLYGEHRSPAM